MLPMEIIMLIQSGARYLNTEIKESFTSITLSGAIPVMMKAIPPLANIEIDSTTTNVMGKSRVGFTDSSAKQPIPSNPKYEKNAKLIPVKTPLYPCGRKSVKYSLGSKQQSPAIIAKKSVRRLISNTILFTVVDSFTPNSIKIVKASTINAPKMHMWVPKKSKEQSQRGTLTPTREKKLAKQKAQVLAAMAAEAIIKKCKECPTRQAKNSPQVEYTQAQENPAD
eukprot:TRINITY_DN186_c0_g1_i1.p2 TRINITY_DN186_c0_g1~~TRINITY_DN186_c0_g1_i1.p2  ORF type:complete len:224 (-),score=3.66 TRINITY_DN186_c0_g1_i1:627-1298(-)